MGLCPLAMPPLLTTPTTISSPLPACPCPCTLPPQGLIPRATVLLKLGGGFFLAFLPFMAGISILFTSIYLVS